MAMKEEEMKQQAEDLRDQEEALKEISQQTAAVLRAAPPP